MKRFTRLGACLLGAAFAFSAIGCGSDPDPGLVRIGGKTFTEEFILAQAATVLLESKGYEVDDSVALPPGVSTEENREGVENGELDVYFEYTGSALVLFLGVNDNERLSDPENIRFVRELDTEFAWGIPGDFSTSYAFSLDPTFAADNNLTTLSGLVAHAKANPGLFTWLVGSHQIERPDGIMSMCEHYNYEITLDDLLITDTELDINRWEWIEEGRELPPGKVPIIEVYRTDGELSIYDRAVMQDDQTYYPHYAPTPTMLKSFDDQNPEVMEILNEITSRLDETEMSALNYAAAGLTNPEELKAVAAEWLTDKGLLR